MRRLGWLGLAAVVAAMHAFVFRGEFFAARDFFRIYIPDAFFTRESLLAGEFPLWNPHVRLGQPFVAALLQQAFYPPKLLPVLLVGPYWGPTVEQILHVVFATLGAALAARKLGATSRAAWLSGATFGLGTLLSRIDSLNVTGTITWSGWMIAAALDLARRPGLRPALKLAFFTCLSLLAGLPEALLWQGPACALAAFSARRRVRPLLWVGAAGLWGLALAAFTMLPAAEFAASSNRAHIAQSAHTWSVGWIDLLALVLRGANRPLSDYAQDQLLVLGLDIGLVAATMVPFALVGRNRRRRMLPLLLWALFLALLSLGERFPPAKAVLSIFPFRMFRYPVKYALGTCFLFCLLAGPGLSRLSALASRWKPRRALALASFPLAVLAGVGAYGAARGLELRAGLAAGVLPAAFMLACLAAAVLAAPGAGRRRMGWVVAGVLATAAIDLGFAHAMTGRLVSLPAPVLQRPSRTAPAVRESGFERISLGPDIEDEWPPGKLESIPLGSTERYLAASRDALIPNWAIVERLWALEGNGEPRPHELERLLTLPDLPRNLYDLTGVTWFVRRDEAPFPDLERVLGPSQAHSNPIDALCDLPNFYRSRTAMPRAFVVHAAQVATVEEARAMIEGAEQPFRHTAFVTLPAGVPLPETERCEGSRAAIVDYRPRDVELEVEACGKGIAVLSDAYYPGWKATVDGRPAPILQTDLLLRGVPVTAGKHRIHLRYEPLSFTVGAPTSVLAWAGFLVALAWVVRKRLRRPVG